VLLAACGNADRAAPHVASTSCPLKTPADWQRFLDTSTLDEGWVKTCTVENCQNVVGAFSARLQTDVIDVLARCTADVAENPPIARCTANLRRFVPAWERQHALGSYGFTQNNHDYLAAQTAPDKPAGMMDPPAAILAALPRVEAIEDAARANGWPYLVHDSCFGGARIFVTVADPEDRFEQWMLVGVGAGSSEIADNAIMSFIGIQRKDRAGKSLEKVRLHFRDYILSNAEQIWHLVLPELHDGKCYGCHSSGMRLLLPTHGSVVASTPVRGEPGFGATSAPADFGFRRLVALNQRLLSYGLPDWDGAVDPADHGPPLGASLGCTACHDGAIRGVLTVSADERMLRQKMLDELSMRSFAHGKSVPDETAIALLDREKTGNPPLAPEEQAALDRARAEHLADYRTFVADRFPRWRAWMLEARCEE
jgi:hypothetical protein